MKLQSKFLGSSSQVHLLSINFDWAGSVFAGFFAPYAYFRLLKIVAEFILVSSSYPMY